MSDLDPLIRRCLAQKAELVLVDFSCSFNWRPHVPLWARLDELEARCMKLDPVPILMDGAEFDPIAHFRTWRAIEEAHIGGKVHRKEALAQVIYQLAAEHSRYADLAKVLNDLGHTTTTGKPWTGDNVRKFMQTL